MKISIYNFKSIGSLANYEMRPLTILSGTNSSGKSSFIQLLLLLKQTLEKDSVESQLLLSGDLYKVLNYLDILKDRNRENKIKVEFEFSNLELDKYKNYPVFDIYSALGNYNLVISITFDELPENDSIFVASFDVKFEPTESEIQVSYTRFENNNNSIFTVSTNRPILVTNNLTSRGNDVFVRKINYTAFIPFELEIDTTIPKMDGFAKESSKISSKEVPKLDGIKAILKDFFAKLNYVGSYRKDPQYSYLENKKSYSVGIDGANAAEVLCELKDKRVTFYKIDESNEGFNLIKTEDSFLNAVKYWLCDRFKLCSNIYSIKESDSFVIYVESVSGIISTIKHVGFGISQVLPIILEGLRISNDETLILEQPEVHLHPKVQSNLTDFLISLVEQGKNVIVETHSDHLITRLRRRIAEDLSNQLDEKVLLTFVEVGTTDVLFRNITIDDFGVIELPYPEGFIERTDTELKAILKAQMKKRLNQHK
jgi:predicted ATPase